MYSIDDSYINQALKLVSTVDYKLTSKYINLTKQKKLIIFGMYLGR